MKDWARWSGSFAFVLGLHAGALGLAFGWTRLEAPYAPPPAAVMLEMEPLPAAPQATPSDAPPAPELSEAVPDPQEPPPVDLKPVKIDIQAIEPPPPVEIPLAEIVLPLPEPAPPVDLKPPDKPKPVEKPKPPQPKPKAQAAAPQAAPDHTDRTVAPTQGAASSEPPSAAMPTWKGLLLRHLERHKRYPPEAQRTRREGVVYVRFVMGREGRVLSARIERSSGVASLDQEGLDLLARAQPLPALPSDQPGESLELLVPIQFFLKR